MTGIVFESFDAGAPGSGLGALPALRGFGGAGFSAAGYGFARLPGLRQAPSGAQGPQRLPALRQTLSMAYQPQRLPALRGFGGSGFSASGYGFAKLPGLVGFGSAIDLTPQVSMGFATLPALVGAGQGKFEMAGSGDATLPALRGFGGAGFSAAGYGFAKLPALRGFGIVQGAVGESWVSVLQSPGFVRMTASASEITLANDRLRMGDALACETVHALNDQVRMADAPHALLDALVSVGERMTFADVAGIAWQVLMAETISMAGDPAAWRTVLVEIVDALAMASGARSTQDATIALASAMAFGDSLANVVQADIAESLALTDAQKTTLAATVKMLDGLRLADSLPAPSVTMTALVDEKLALGADLTVQQELAVLLRDGVQFLAQLALDDGVYLAWVMNAETHAFTGYSHYPFNSFATIGGKTYGAKADGIYVLEGDTDAGAAIEAFARGGLSDLGTSKLKRMPSAYLGLTTTGRMVLKVTVVDDDGVRQEHWYALEDRPAGSLRMGRVKLGRGLKSTYWGFELSNVDGADFALDEINWYPVVLDRRL